MRYLFALILKSAHARCGLQRIHKSSYIDKFYIFQEIRVNVCNGIATNKFGYHEGHQAVNNQHRVVTFNVPQLTQSSFLQKINCCNQRP